jgi:pSer/pThr/pTyr-binding forkhead associated (FHA) protein
MSEQKPKLTLAQFSEENLQQGRHILIVESSDSRRAVALNSGVFSIGRHPQNSLVVNSKMISRHHATIAWLQYTEKSEKKDYYYWVIDGKGKSKRSRNGIFVNGKKKSLHRLQSGDIITIGTETKITYNYIPNTKETQSFLRYCSSEKTEYKSASSQDINYKETTIVSQIEIEAARSQYSSS